MLACSHRKRKCWQNVELRRQIRSLKRVMSVRKKTRRRNKERSERERERETHTLRDLVLQTSLIWTRRQRKNDHTHFTGNRQDFSLCYSEIHATFYSSLLFLLPEPSISDDGRASSQLNLQPGCRHRQEDIRRLHCRSTAFVLKGPLNWSHFSKFYTGILFIYCKMVSKVQRCI